MDDSKRRVNPSLLRMLSTSICGTILVVGLVGALISFLFAFEEARNLQDDELREIAQLVSLGDADVRSSKSHTMQPDEPEMRIWLIRTSKTAIKVALPDLTLSFPGNLAAGLHTLNSEGSSWRVYVRPINDEHGLAVAQRTSARDEIARDSALRTLIPFLVIIPILILMTAFLIRILLRQVNEVSIEVDKKDDTDLRPISTEGVPAEILPFVTATNKLLGRVGTSLTQQRQFVADAAHELRSPVTAMMLQLENVTGAGSLPETVTARLAPLGASLVRMGELAEQLLSLARLEAPASTSSDKFDGRAVVVEALAEVFVLADSRNVDLGLVEGEHLTLRGNLQDFRILARNALENAVLYTPPGGKVDVRFYRDANTARLVVEDSGPGIADDELPKVFAPFYRVAGSGQPGSGLGLAIVRSAAGRLGGTASLQNIGTYGKTGLRFTYLQALVLESPNSLAPS